MPPDDEVRLRHRSDEMLRLALTKLVEIVSEALAAARLRDRLVHHYFDIDLDVPWSTIVVDLPALLAVVPRPGSGR